MALSTAPAAHTNPASRMVVESLDNSFFDAEIPLTDVQKRIVAMDPRILTSEETRNNYRALLTM